MSKIEELDRKIKEVCPIDGVARLKDGSTRIDFKVEATAEQKAAANALISAFDWNVPSAAEMVKEAKKSALLALDPQKIADLALRAVVEYLQQESR